jgi:hypothetical protein
MSTISTEGAVVLILAVLAGLLLYGFAAGQGWAGSKGL